MELGKWEVRVFKGDGEKRIREQMSHEGRFGVNQRGKGTSRRMDVGGGGNG